MIYANWWEGIRYPSPWTDNSVFIQDRTGGCRIVDATANRIVETDTECLGTFRKVVTINHNRDRLGLVTRVKDQAATIRCVILSSHGSKVNRLEVHRELSA